MVLLSEVVLQVAASQMQCCQLVMFSFRQAPVEGSKLQEARRRKKEIQIEFVLTGRV
jgi:hypothetical protein